MKEKKNLTLSVSIQLTLCIHYNTHPITSYFGNYFTTIRLTLHTMMNCKCTWVKLFHSQQYYSPGWASASFKSFLHHSQFRTTTVQFLHPNFAASSQCSLGLLLGHFPPGSLRRTLLDKSLSSWHMTCPAHLNLLNLQNFTISFSSHNW